MGIRIESRYIGSILHIKLYRRHDIELTKPFLYSCHKNFPYRLLVFKLYLVFGRMYIHIYRLRINRKIKEIARLLVCRNKLLITMKYCLMEVRMTHIATVYSQVL